MNMLIKTMAIVAAVGAAPALGQLPGLPAAPPEPPTSVRPSDKPERPIVVQQNGASRGSLYKQAAQAPMQIASDGSQVGGSPVDFTEVGPAKPKKFQKHDLVTIIVAENSATATSSKSKIEKKQDFDFQLQQFLQLATTDNGIPTVQVNPNPAKLPEVKFAYDNNRDNQAGLQRSDTFSDRITALVVDVKPNGTMEIEAVRQITVDREVQQYRMSGICRAEDITGDNTVLSTQLADLNLSKKTMGEVRDGVKSGWLNNLIDKYNPF